MLNSKKLYHNELYNTISSIGLTSTEDTKIRESKKHGKDSFYLELPLSYEDINQIGYLYPHFKIDAMYEGYLELWIDEEYINPQNVTWIRTDLYLYGILNKDYDTTTQYVKAFYNFNIIDRYTVMTEDQNALNHIFIMDITDQAYENIQYPDRSVYYISNNKIQIPDITWTSDTTIRFSCPYTNDIDMFICSNLIGIFEANKNIGLYIDNPSSKYCYHRILSDNDEEYDIDARFYPCILVDRDCIIRVYDDIVSELMYPEVSRLILYPEFINIDDPYNTTNEYLTQLKRCDDIIYSVNKDDVIIEKFKNISAYCYRIWEKFPIFSNEQSNFVVCSNTFANKYFVKVRLYTEVADDECIVSTAPFEDSRDMMFYNGVIFTDYKILPISITDSNTWVENASGMYRYVIPNTYHEDDFTLIKFNSAEDTSIMNIDEYFNEYNMITLHNKLNRFYRNLLVLRTELLDIQDTESVRVSTSEPKVKDNHLWFQLLVNVVPEMFKTNTVDTINLYGLDPNNIPKDVVEGAYKLDLDPQDGPASYNEILMTYFNLDASKSEYLALQYGEGIDDPRTVVFNNIKNGTPAGNEALNTMLIEDNNTDSNYTEEVIEYGSYNSPGTLNRSVGDLYLQEEQSIDSILDDIDVVDTPDSKVDNDLLTGLTTAVNNNYTVDNVDDPNVGTYALDNIEFIDEFTGKTIEPSIVEALSSEDKLKIVQRYITDENVLDPQITSLWVDYLANVTEETLNVIVYRILLVNYAYGYSPNDTDVASEFVDDTGSSLDYNTIKEQNVRYIMSVSEPIDPQIGDSWINIPAASLTEYVTDIISKSLVEAGYKLPDGYTDATYASTVFDYNANGTDVSVYGELFSKDEDQSLHEIKYGYPDEFDENYSDTNIWYEFLSEIDNKICYSDENTMVLKIDERLMLLLFESNNIQSFAFDDILLNFRGKLGVKYIAILADLINSNVIKQEEVIVFYNRMITFPDEFKLELRRLYTETSHVVALNDVNTTDLSVLYSSNIGRFRMDYASDTTLNREREAAYKMCIDYRYRDFAFIRDRMLLFVNGKYIPDTAYDEDIAYTIRLHNFNEIIKTVDILYNKKDEWLIKIKRNAYIYWQSSETAQSIQRPNRDYKTMMPIKVYNTTSKGYYDVLLEEYILNGKLERILNYLIDHPSEYPQFKKDMVRRFHAISDIDLANSNDEDARIVISGGSVDPAYTIE